LLFADDLKLFLRVRDRYSSEEMQSDLNAVAKWCKLNGLHINESKCKYMRFSRKKITDLNNTYMVEGKELERVFRYKDLGLVMDPTLSFSEHLDYIISKGNMRLGYVLRNSRDFADLRLCTILYCALVRSVLEYGSVIWNPHPAHSINRLERIQIKFLKYLCFKMGMEYHRNDYNNILKYVGLLTLQDRRSIADVNFGVKVLNSNLNCSDLLQNMHLNATTRSNRHRPPLYLGTSKTNYSANSVVNRVINSINQHSREIDIFANGPKEVNRILRGLFNNSYV